ncbi:hypothetical protein H072_9815 [Dactylellina haptotyla CBS 200.50]|uniref:Uncharacterized protein n=1 Tax=Dactylellina haptotyla (strain CBS 200.50) TaxID=1284197 RepID=S8A0Q5_DACHA|nr:hypothetical protein H072_9815 [Dactylellina haptotyla CBS 200.50]
MKLLVPQNSIISRLVIYFSIANVVFANPHPQGGGLEDGLQKSLEKLRSQQDYTRPAPPTSEWAPSQNSIAVRKAQWDEFANGLTTNMTENPLWYIFHGGYLLRNLARDAERLSMALYPITEDKTWWEFRDEFFKIISPLMTEFVPTEETRPDGRKVSVYRQNKHLTTGYLESGIMDKGGIFDTSFPRDDKAVQAGVTNPFPRDTLTMKVLVKKLFQDTVEDFDGVQVVFASDDRFKQVWYTILAVYDRLGPFVDKVAMYVNRLEWVKPKTKSKKSKQPKIVVDVRPRQTKEFNRQEVGYAGYYKKFAEELALHENEVSDPVLFSTAFMARALGFEDSPNMFAAYGIMINTIYRSVLPLMMDMFADIAVRMNNLAKKSVSGADANWGILKTPDANLLGILRNWPEWTEGRYRDVAWPIPQEHLAAALPILAALRKERQEAMSGGS